MYARGSGLAGVWTRLSGGFDVAAFADLELMAYLMTLCMGMAIVVGMGRPLWDIPLIGVVPACLLRDKSWC